ncbi:MAG: glycosyltransferase [Oscillospiraceae bacterium]|jgi:glycosyltransferase involved in cell wall biosynthesis|nr:glycosyltransferase [Oscillospiraceae bacterium]
MIADMISVVVTIHNTKMYLPKRVKNILDQTYKNLEIILVDDGSIDGCAELCDQYQAADPRVRVIHQAHLGAAAARAAGMRAATGEFTHFVDDDDWMELNMEEEMLKAQKKTGADVVISSYFVERGGVTRKGGPGHCPQGIYDRERMERELFPVMMSINGTIERGVPPNLWSKLFRSETCREAILRVDPRIYKANDFAACYEALYNANKIVIIPDRYYHYRLSRPNSITTTCVTRYYESMLALLDHLLSSPMARNPAIARQILYVMRGSVSRGMKAGYGKDSAEDQLRRELISRLRQLEPNIGVYQSSRRAAQSSGSQPADGQERGSGPESRSASSPASPRGSRPADLTRMPDSPRRSRPADRTRASASPRARNSITRRPPPRKQGG